MPVDYHECPCKRRSTIIHGVWIFDKCILNDDKAVVEKFDGDS